ncbi:MAG: DinB family protein [Bacteroidetes bacterium]|nr:DinB family protein [Bacteroidota bacterium]MCW5897125.1 DinB family protein [Bacteroidota bacterium]
MSPQLQTLVAEIDACSGQAKSLLGSSNKSHLTKRPANGGWSAVECVKHLTLTTDLYLNLLPPLIQQAKEQGKIGDGPYKMDWKGRLLKWILEPPYRTKVKTIQSLEVVTTESPKEVLAEFLAAQSRLRETYESANGVALDKVVMRSPFNERMKYNLYSCFCVIPAHQRRHLWQGEQACLRVQ